jgi:hypothetical protein
MYRTLLATALAAGTAFGAYAQTDPASPSSTKLSMAECQSLWNQASPDGKPISESAAAAYVTDFKAANPDGDTTLEQNEFSKACESGLVKSSASSGASTGESGAAVPGQSNSEKMAPQPQ